MSRRLFVCLFVVLVAISASAQSSGTGHSTYTGAQLWRYFLGTDGGPLTYSARTDMGVFCNASAPVPGELFPYGTSFPNGANGASVCPQGDANCANFACNASSAQGQQGAAMIYTGGPTSVPPAAGTTVTGPNIYGLNSYYTGINTVAFDPDFGTPFIRATEGGMSTPCQGTANLFGSAQFSMGTSGTTRNWASDNSKLLVTTNGGTTAMLAFDPTYVDPVSGKVVGKVTPTNLCGGYLPGAATFSGSNPDTLYVMNHDNENVLQFASISGTPADLETLNQGATGANVTVYAVNSTFLMVSGTQNNKTADCSPWIGQTSGVTVTPGVSCVPPAKLNATPYAATIYKGLINDSDHDATKGYFNWPVTWSLVFDFNYSTQMAGDPHWPALPTSALPEGYPVNWTGVFATTQDDSTFTSPFSDSSQANHNGSNGSNATCHGLGAYVSYLCTGPIYESVFTPGTGKGVRTLNTWTGQITGDWGPTGQAIDGQANNITTSSINGTITHDDILIQDSTGAEAQFDCFADSTGQCVPGATIANVGLIYRGSSNTAPDSSHVWRDCGAAPTTLANCSSVNYFTPSAVPVSASFYYPDVMHDGTALDDPALSNFSMVQGSNGQEIWVYQVAYNHTTHQTTISFNNAFNASPGQVFTAWNFTGTHDAYLKCVSAANCPHWTVVSGGDSSIGYLVVTDTQGGSSDYTDTETPASKTNQNGAMLQPWGQGGYDRMGYVGGNFWQNQTLIINSNIGATGHSARGYKNNYQGKNYQAYNYYNPSTPATDDGTVSGALYAPSTRLADAQTPPPGSNVPNLVPYTITDDQHGIYQWHGKTDLSPVGMATALVCGQASGTGMNVCPPAYSSIWDDEVIAIQNAVTQSSPGHTVGEDCDYGSGPAPCVYRLFHTFNPGDDYNLGAQNTQSSGSPDGQWVAFPSIWNRTLGCMNGAVLCESSWQATAPSASGTAVSWTSDSSGNVTVTMPNSFCPPGGTQGWNTSSEIICGAAQPTVTLSGFTGSDTWLNATWPLIASANWGAWSLSASGTCASSCYPKFVVATGNAGPHNSSGTETGAQAATPTSCGAGSLCQKSDIFIAHITLAAPAHTVSLNWTQGDGNAASNVVYRSSTNGGPYTQIYASSSPITTYKDTTVPQHATSYYVVTEKDSSGAESSNSNQATAVVP